jgi:AhpD family alkylhydroperoxidase
LQEALVNLEHLTNALSASAGISRGLAHLLRLRASQINRCSYCVRLHTRDALAQAESADRVALVAAWRETEYFSKKERASFALIEAITLISEGQISDDVYSDAAGVLSEEEIAAVEWIGITINAWNRMSIASRPFVRP